MAGLPTVAPVTIALATGRPYADLDVDLPLLLAAASARGLDAEVAVWDDDSVDWSAYDVVVVRSCWDYLDRRDAFLAWAAQVPNLLNPADVLTWNTDKVYLRELADAGVPVIDTRWDVRRGDDLPDSDGRVGGQAEHLRRLEGHRPMEPIPTTSTRTARS